MILEVCCGNLESVHAAVRGGAPRIELCSRLDVDGLTPPWEDLRTARRLYPSLRIAVLIRPREGDFCYSPAEVAQMMADIESAFTYGADGVVFGCLTPEGDVDVPAMQQLMECVNACALARSLARSGCHGASDSFFFAGAEREPEVCFHRAFDHCRWPFDALEEIIGLGCTRILTSGLAPSAAEGTDLLRELRERAAGRIGILPGGGVTPANAHRIVQLTGCTQIHASASERQPDGTRVTSEQRVREILSAIGA